MKAHRGPLILVLGILSLVLCGPFTAIPAWIMANNDLREMDAGLMDPSGRSLTTAGKICGIVSLALLGIGIVIWLLMVMLAIGGAALSS